MTASPPFTLLFTPISFQFTVHLRNKIWKIEKIIKIIILFVKRAKIYILFNYILKQTDVFAEGEKNKVENWGDTDRN